MVLYIAGVSSLSISFLSVSSYLNHIFRARKWRQRIFKEAAFGDVQRFDLFCCFGVFPHRVFCCDLKERLLSVLCCLFFVACGVDPCDVVCRERAHCNCNAGRGGTRSRFAAHTMSDSIRVYYFHLILKIQTRYTLICFCNLGS